MKKFLIAACRFAFVGGATAASAQMNNGMMDNSMSKSSMRPTAIRAATRSGAPRAYLDSLKDMALRALR